MKNYICLIILFVFGSYCYGQVIQRQSGESTEQFAIRVKPVNSELTHKVIDSKWNAKPVVIAFYNQTYKLPKRDDQDQIEYHRIIAMVFIQTSENNYRKVVIDTIDPEGSDPIIETVFFANADQDSAKELAIIVSWEQQHSSVSGTLYGTFIFDDFHSNEKKLIFLKEISEKLDGGCNCSWDDGTTKKAKYKSAKDIKLGLLKLGFK